MAFDVYSSCPCGSGKKLKFCCHTIAVEMEKVQKLRDTDQARLALQLLDKLGKSHADNAWVATTRALAFLDEGSHAEAKETLQAVVQVHPQNDLVLALYALSSLATDGYESARAVVHRAFQRCAASFPDLVGGIALSVAQYMLATNRYLAARQHLALAMRFASEKARQDVFVRLLQLDSDRSIPYPLRGVHHLATFVGSDELKKEASKGVALCTVGCFGPAARLLSRLAEQNTDNAALWQNIGLCRAWDGDEIGAADALHRAAQLQGNFETAVECETVAQLLDLSLTADRVATLPLEYRVKSVSRLLSLLDNHDRLARQEISAEEFEKALGLGIEPSGLFDVLDRSLDEKPADSSTSLSDLASVLAQIVIFDADTESEIDARAVLTRFDVEESRDGQRLFESIAGDEIVPVAAGEEEYVLPGHWSPREFLPLQQRSHFPALTRLRIRRALERQKWEQFAYETWPRTGLARLAGKSPQEAAEMPELRTQLMASLYVLDAVSVTHEYALDFNALCEKLPLKPPHTIEVTDELPLNSFSPMQLQRLPLTQLSDAQLSTVLNRALLIHHPVFLYDALVESLQRPACAEKVNLTRAYWTLAELCRNRGDQEEALSWIIKGRDSVKAADKDALFEARLEWSMRELSLRIEDPEDPGFAPFLRHIWEYYVPKLPRLADHLAGLLAAVGLQTPLGADTVVGANAGFGSSTEGGIWTPQEASSSRETGKKLWLPGQE